VGEQGYRLVSAIDRMPIGIVKLDEVQYQYIAFNTVTRSDLFFITGGFERNYSVLEKEGYHLIDQFVSSISSWTDQRTKEDVTEVKQLFLLEKEKEVWSSTRHLFINSVPSWRKPPSEELSTQINEKLAAGFYPGRVLSKFEILLEESKNNDERIVPGTQVRVVGSSLGLRDDAILEKKVNELASQGYRLGLVGNEIAVLYRHSDTATPVSYVWVDAKKKDFEKRLNLLQTQGAVYRMTYPNRQGTENQLIFMTSSIENGERREYKVLKFDFEETLGSSDQKVHIDLTPESKETMKLLNNLAKDGFVVRDLFLSDKISVLLERYCQLNPSK